MKHVVVIIALLAMAAAAQAKDKDVIVINDESRPVPVVEKTSSQPISASAAELIDSEGDGQRSQIVVFEVPEGKILAVDYVSYLLDVVVSNRPASELRLLGELRGTLTDLSGIVTFRLGFMEELELTSRGTPNFLIATQVPVYFGQGDVVCIADSSFGGVNLNFGLKECAISGRLIDAAAP